MMEVILREDVKTLGKAGALVKVKPGYARNFLLPRGLAYEATEGNKKRLAAESKAREAKAATEKNRSRRAGRQTGRRRHHHPRQSRRRRPPLRLDHVAGHRRRAGQGRA